MLRGNSGLVIEVPKHVESSSKMQSNQIDLEDVASDSIYDLPINPIHYDDDDEGRNSEDDTRIIEDEGEGSQWGSEPEDSSHEIEEENPNDNEEDVEPQRNHLRDLPLPTQASSSLPQLSEKDFAVYSQIIEQMKDDGSFSFLFFSLFFSFFSFFSFSSFPFPFPFLSFPFLSLFPLSLFSSSSFFLLLTFSLKN